MDAQKTRYEFIDPTNGDYGTAYTATTKAEIIEKAEQVGASRFTEIGPDDSKTAHVKVDGEWQLASEIERKQKAAAAVEALSRQIQNGVQHNEAVARQTPEERAEVAQATRDFGGDPVKDDERRAAIGIEARSIAFANASADAKHDKLADLPAGDIGARMAELSQPEPNVLPADVSRQWAKLDAQEFSKIQGEGIESDVRRETAANAIAANMVSMPGNVMVYNDQPGMAGAEIHTPDGQVIAFGGKPAIEQFAEENKLAPEDTAKLLALDAMADQHRNGSKDADKVFDELDNNAKWDAAALARMEEARRRDFAEVRESMGLNTIEPNIEREKQRLEGEAEAGRQAWLAQAAAEKQQPAKSAQQGQAPGGNGVESDEIFTATQADTKAIVPPEIEKQYLRVGDKFYPPKNTEVVAFEDKGNKLETKSNSENIAESMVRIAEARGWDEIKVTGSETFRREVWLEAAARGMHVKGYTPSEQDKAALAKRAGEAEVNRVEKETTPFRGRENEKAAPDSANKQRAEAFAKEAPAEAVKKHPELAGAAAAMAAIDKKAEADGLNPAQRAVVAARVKQNVVNAIERGDIPEVKAREQVEQKREASNIREYAR